MMMNQNSLQGLYTTLDFFDAETPAALSLGLIPYALSRTAAYEGRYPLSLTGSAGFFVLLATLKHSLYELILLRRGKVILYTV